MSNEQNTNDDETFIDPDKGQCRRHRRSSVQFIDKSLIRRRSSGNDKQGQQQRLLSFDTTYESNDLEHFHRYSETPLPREKSSGDPLSPGCDKHRDICFIDCSSTSFFSSSLLATASDSDSDADDETGINIRELSHVSADGNDSLNAQLILCLFLLEKLLGLYKFRCATY